MTGKTEKMTVRLTEEEKEMILKESERNNQSVSAFVIHCATGNVVVSVAEKCKIYQKLQEVSEYVCSEEGKELLDEIAGDVGRL